METISSYHPAEAKKISAIATQAGIVEDLEQRRRLMDLEGEGHRICIASRTSEILKGTTIELNHVPLPTSAPLEAKAAEVTFTSQGVAILNAVQGALDGALDIASSFAGDTYHKTTEAVSELGHKTAETASAFSHKTAEVASSFSHGAVDLASRTVGLATSFGEMTVEAASGAASAISHTTADLAAKSVDLASKSVDIAASLGEKTAEVAIVVGEKTVSAASAVGHKTAEVAAVMGEKTSEVADAAAIAAGKTFAVASDLGHKTAEVATEVAWPKAQELAHAVSQTTAVVAATVIPIAQDFAIEAKSRLVHLADDITYSTTKAYVTAVIEAERRRRLLDINEQYAILNALAVSHLFKDLAPEFYRQSDCCYAYSFKLLEELERKWRLLPANTEVALANARNISKLVENRCFPIAHLEKMYTTGKIEIVEDVPFKQVKHDFTGTPTL